MAEDPPFSFGDTFSDSAKNHTFIVISDWIDGVAEYQSSEEIAFYSGEPLDDYDPDLAIESRAVIIANFTTNRDLAVRTSSTDEPACIIRPSKTCHPNIKFESYIYYANDFLTEESCEDFLKYPPKITPETPIEDEILDKVQEQAKYDDNFPQEKLDILREQGHIT